MSAVNCFNSLFTKGGAKVGPSVAISHYLHVAEIFNRLSWPVQLAFTCIERKSELCVTVAQEKVATSQGGNRSFVDAVVEEKKVSQLWKFIHQFVYDTVKSNRKQQRGQGVTLLNAGDAGNCHGIPNNVTGTIETPMCPSQ